MLLQPIKAKVGKNKNLTGFRTGNTTQSDIYDPSGGLLMHLKRDSLISS